MGIAIRRDACERDLKGLVKHYEEQARASIRMSCPSENCAQEYVIYFQPPSKETEVREGFMRYLTRDHPHHPLLYEIDESVPNP